jgi:hypothetical protein
LAGRATKKSASESTATPERAELFSNLVFYHQGRVDGGIHMGVDAFDTSLLESFENEAPDDESDPVLSWYIDIRCKGRRLPTTAREAREWFLKHGDLIRTGLGALAEELRVGLDVESYPYRWDKFVSQPNGVQITLVCMVHRRTGGLKFARYVQAFADHYGEILNRLAELRPDAW